jgi:hypothetical protein
MVLKPVQTLFAVVGALDAFGGAQPTMTDSKATDSGSSNAVTDMTKARPQARLETTEKAESEYKSTLSAPSKDADVSSGVGSALELEVGLGSTAMSQESQSPQPSSLRMYMLSPALRETLISGVSVNSLPEFTSMLEQAAAEILQKYAVVMATPKESTAGKAALAALNKESRASGKENPARAALGPTQGTKTSRSGITSSSLMAALVDTDTMLIPEDEEEDVKPFTISDLKEQAAAQLRSQQFTSAKAASKQAAQYLLQTEQRHVR